MDATDGARRALGLVAWLGVATAGTVMLTQAFGWTGTRTIAALQSLTPYLVLAMAPIAVGAARSRRHGLGFTAALIGAGGMVLAFPIAFPPGQPSAADGATGIRVAAVNLLFHNERIDDSADAVLAEDADVIVFSEYTAEHRTALEAHPLGEGFPHRLEREGFNAGGIAIWSNVPLAERASLDTTNFSIAATVDGPDGPFSMLAIHPPAPVFDFDAWRHDLGLIRDRARDTRGPTLIIGDFNASMWHPGYRDLMAEGFVDAHLAHGKGWSTSWPVGDWRPTFVRLDHALTGRGLVSTGVSDFHVPGSDHRALVVTVAPAR